jgi:hypothetical protein
MTQMERKHFLAAQIYGYSYSYYADNLDQENVRFTTLMPEEVDILEQAERENWEPQQLAEALGIEPVKIDIWQELYRTSKSIVDAGSCIDSFRASLRSILQTAVREGLESDDVIERVVTQICFKTADLAYLLTLEQKELSDYTDPLRQTVGVDEAWLIAQFGDIADQF